MNKKIYQSPATELVAVAMGQLLAGSAKLSGSTAEVDSDGNYVTPSRRRSLWEDDEEEY